MSWWAYLPNTVNEIPHVRGGRIGTKAAPKWMKQSFAHWGMIVMWETIPEQQKKIPRRPREREPDGVYIHGL